MVMLGMLARAGAADASDKAAASPKARVVISCPDDVQLHCGDSTDPSNTGSATATAINCNGTIKIRYTDTPLPPGCTGLPGILRTWTASACGASSLSCLQHITVVDTTPPVFQTQPLPDVNVQCGDAIPDPPPTTSFVATDDCDPSPTISFSSVSTAPDGNGDYQIRWIWTATDQCKNSSSVSTLVFVYGCLTPSTVSDTIDLSVNGLLERE